MFGLYLLKRMPPTLTANLFYFGLPVILIIRFLIGTIFGIFLLSLTLYGGMWLIGDSKPLTLDGLVLWIDGLKTESKTAVLTSLLTVLGFLVAFHTATLNWRAEALAHLKANVAGEIEQFFTEASRLTVDAQIYVRSLIGAVNTVKTQGQTSDSNFEIKRALEQVPKFLAVRNRLSAMSVEVHSLSGRHHSLLSTVPGSIRALEECATAFTEVTQHMWVHVPNIAVNNPDPFAEFVRQVNVSACTDFVACCERNYDFISGTTGAIRGLLVAPLIGFNFSSVLSLAGRRSTFVEALAKIHAGNPKK